MKNVICFLLVMTIIFNFIACKKDTTGGQLEITEISANHGSYGSTMTITVNNFSAGKDTIKINGMPCNVTGIQGSEITIDIPKASGSGYITITDGTTILKGPPFKYIYTCNVTTLAGSLDSGSVDGTGLGASFLHLDGVAVSSTGILYTTEFTGDNQYIDTYPASSRIRQINAAGVVTTFSGSGHYGFQDGPASVAGFGDLAAIAIDAVGNLYVTDYYYNRIRKITTTGDVSTIAGNGNAGFVDGPADSASFNGPTGVTLDAIGNVYVADNGNVCIRRISPDGMVTTLTDKGFITLTNASQNHVIFESPWALCFDLQGNLLVGDKGNIWKTSLSGTKDFFYSTDDGPHPDGFSYNNGIGRITGLVVDSHGNVYASDLDYSVVYQISIYGTNIFAGIPGQYPGQFLPFSDGPLLTATFINPSQLALDKDDNLYIADGYRMRKIAIQ